MQLRIPHWNQLKIWNETILLTVFPLFSFRYIHVFKHNGNALARNMTPPFSDIQLITKDSLRVRLSAQIISGSCVCLNIKLVVSLINRLFIRPNIRDGLSGKSLQIYMSSHKLTHKSHRMKFIPYTFPRLVFNALI